MKLTVTKENLTNYLKENNWNIHTTRVDGVMYAYLPDALNALDKETTEMSFEFITPTNVLSVNVKSGEIYYSWVYPPESDPFKRL